MVLWRREKMGSGEVLKHIILLLKETGQELLR